MFERLGGPSWANATWASARVPLAAFAGHTIRIVFVAGDGGPGNLVEAAIDDVRIERAG